MREMPHAVSALRVTPFVNSVVDGLVDPLGRLRFVSRLLSIRPAQSARKRQGKVGRYKGLLELLTGTEKEAGYLFMVPSLLF